MKLQSILSFLVITEKFALSDIDLIVSPDMNPKMLQLRPFDTIDQLSPVYKDTNDMFINIGSIVREADPPINIPFYSDNEITKFKVPTFRTYFDFTNRNRNPLTGASIDGNMTGASLIQSRAPVEVQIRIQFVEPNQDTLGVNKHRRFLRTGQLQFLVISHYDKKDELEDAIRLKGPELNEAYNNEWHVYTDRRPLFEAFKIAQYYADKYEGTDGIKILMDIDKKEKEKENKNEGITKSVLEGNFEKKNQFEHIDESKLAIMLDHLFPGEGAPYERIVQEVKTLNTGVARIVNLRFAELERRTVDPIRITNPTYGLAVTIPFTFEQTR